MLLFLFLEYLFVVFMSDYRFVETKLPLSNILIAWWSKFRPVKKLTGIMITFLVHLPGFFSFNLSVLHGLNHQETQMLDSDVSVSTW